MTQVYGGVAECDNCGQSIQGTIHDSVIITRATPTFSRVETLHLCLKGVEDAPGCAVALNEVPLEHYYNKPENQPETDLTKTEGS